MLVARYDVDAHDADDGLGPVTDGVGELVGAHLRGRESHGAQIQVGHEGRRGGRGRHLGQREHVPVGVGVVGQGRDDEGFGDARDVEVGVRDGRDVAVFLHEDGELALGGDPAVGHGQGDLARPGAAAEVVDRDGPVLGELDRQSLGALGALEEDLVTVGVDPIGQHVVFDLGARAEFDAGVVDALGSGVFAPGVDAQGYVRGRRGQAVGRGVGEGAGAFRVVGDACDL